MRINLLLAFLTLTFFSTSLFAQITSSDNLGIYPAAQASFNPSGQFTSLGESGGAPGPTANGCDLYGFRAQTNTTTAVNLGIQNALLLNIIPVQVPTLSFGDTKPLWIVEQNATGSGNGSVNGCGKLLGYFRDLNSNVFTILGSATATGGTWQTSDLKLKRNVEPIGNALSIVSQLNGYTYEYRTEERPELNLTEGRQYGFITQEVQEVMPEVVRYGQDEMGEESDYQVMQYTAVIPVLTEAIKEQQSIIEQQDDRLAEQLEINQQMEDRLESQQNTITTLEARLAALEAKLSGAALPNPTIDATVGTVTAEGVSLRQNRPNPFQGVTLIDYTIPSDMSNAQLIIYDLNGKALANFDLAPGDGQVRINATDLSNGVYFYAIENNGQSLARQKMIVK